MNRQAGDTSQSSQPSVYEHLRADLINGFLPPSEKLQLSGLAERYGTSMGPVREALSRLDAEGLVHKKGQRGFWAADISIAEFQEVSRLRLILETDALEISIKQGDLDWESRIVGSLHRVKSALERTRNGECSDTEDLVHENRCFHMALIAGCKSKRQIDFISSLYDQSERFRRRSQLDTAEVEQELAEHQQLMEYALARDSKKACRLLRRHIEEYGSRVAAALTP